MQAEKRLADREVISLNANIPLKSKKQPLVMKTQALKVARNAFILRDLCKLQRDSAKILYSSKTWQNISSAKKIFFLKIYV